MANARKTPQLKKARDYDKQRRAHQNNDKSAREWIPQAKRRQNKRVRIQSKKLTNTVATAEDISFADDSVSNEQLKSLDLRNPIHKDGLETLRQHVAHQQRQRKSQPGKR